MANTVSVTCYAQHSSYQNICLNKTIHQVGRPMSLFISVFEQLWHTNINLRYFFIFNFYQNYTGGGSSLTWNINAASCSGQGLKMDTLFATTKPHYINVKKVDVTEISHIHLNGCGSRIWTDDLRVMSPTSYRAALSRDIQLCCFLQLYYYSIM